MTPWMTSFLAGMALFALDAAVLIYLGRRLLSGGGARETRSRGANIGLFLALLAKVMIAGVGVYLCLAVLKLHGGYFSAGLVVALVTFAAPFLMTRFSLSSGRKVR